MNRTAGFFCFLLVTLHSAIAAESTIIVPEERYFDSGIPTTKPQLFLFDHSGELIYQKAGVEQGLKRVFKNTDIINKGGEIKAKLLTMVDQIPVFADYDYTLIFLTDFHPNACPPCVTQNQINKQVTKSIKDKNIHLINLPVEFGPNRTVTIL